jgi:hypothetical protein
MKKKRFSLEQIHQTIAEGVPPELSSAAAR